jgi:hypothetical protein
MKPQIKSFVTEYLAELIEGNAAIFAGAGLSDAPVRPQFPDSHEAPAGVRTANARYIGDRWRTGSSNLGEQHSGLFKEVKLNRGRRMASASQDF